MKMMKQEVKSVEQFTIAELERRREHCEELVVRGLKSSAKGKLLMEQAREKEEFWEHENTQLRNRLTQQEGSLREVKQRNVELMARLGEGDEVGAKIKMVATKRTTTGHVEIPFLIERLEAAEQRCMMFEQAETEMEIDKALLTEAVSYREEECQELIKQNERAVETEKKLEQKVLLLREKLTTAEQEINIHENEITESHQLVAKGEDDVQKYESITHTAIEAASTAIEAASARERELENLIDELEKQEQLMEAAQMLNSENEVRMIQMQDEATRLKAEVEERAAAKDDEISRLRDALECVGNANARIQLAATEAQIAMRQATSARQLHVLEQKPRLRKLGDQKTSGTEVAAAAETTFIAEREAARYHLGQEEGKATRASLVAINHHAEVALEMKELRPRYSDTCQPCNITVDGGNAISESATPTGRSCEEVPVSEQSSLTAFRDRSFRHGHPAFEEDHHENLRVVHIEQARKSTEVGVECGRRGVGVSSELAHPVSRSDKVKNVAVKEAVSHDETTKRSIPQETLNVRTFEAGASTMPSELKVGGSVREDSYQPKVSKGFREGAGERSPEGSSPAQTPRLERFHPTANVTHHEVRRTTSPHYLTPIGILPIPWCCDEMIGQGSSQELATPPLPAGGRSSAPRNAPEASLCVGRLPQDPALPLVSSGILTPS